MITSLFSWECKYVYTYILISLLLVLLFFLFNIFILQNGYQRISYSCQRSCYCINLQPSFGFFTDGVSLRPFKWYNCHSLFLMRDICIIYIKVYGALTPVQYIVGNAWTITINLEAQTFQKKIKVPCHNMSDCMLPHRSFFDFRYNIYSYYFLLQ